MPFTPTEPSPAAPSPQLARTVRRVLRPLVRLMLTHGVTVRPAAELLSQVYVEVAMAELERDGKKPTDSRLSVMTGIHRKALRAHRTRSEPAPAGSGTSALSAQLVARWRTDAAYCEPGGRPRALPRRTNDDAAPSFDGLVRSVSSDVHPRTVLDEWLRLGVVEIDGHDQSIRLVPSALVPAQDLEAKLSGLGGNVHDHLETAVHNLEDRGPARFERSVTGDGLDSDSVNALSGFIEQAATEVLDAIERRIHALEARSMRAVGDAGEAATAHDFDEPDAKHERVRLGVYFHREPAPVEPEEQDGDERSLDR